MTWKQWQNMNLTPRLQKHDFPTFFTKRYSSVWAVTGSYIIHFHFNVLKKYRNFEISLWAKLHKTWKYIRWPNWPSKQHMEPKLNKTLNQTTAKDMCDSPPLARQRTDCAFAERPSRRFICVLIATIEVFCVVASLEREHLQIRIPRCSHKRTVLRSQRCAVTSALRYIGAHFSGRWSDQKWILANAASKQYAQVAVFFSLNKTLY